MAIEKRAPANAGSSSGIGGGIYLAKVVSLLDPSYMGTLEVTLLRRQGNEIGDDNQSYIVRYASPFFGSTAFEFMGANKGDFNDTQKSYGMWFVPPDVGVTVLVTFVDGNPAEGYWLACVPDRFANHMVPGIASTTYVESPDAKYSPSKRLPVAELNRRANDGTNNTDVDRIKKAVHPLADHLLEEGLLDDDVRGSHNSSARRDIPSMVFGISTPGPLDRRPGAKKSTIGKKLTKSPAPVPVSRLGGTQLIMDDGDDQYQRKTSASEGPVQYEDTLAGGKGQPDIPYGESFRIRTRTGHQILLHNSEDLIYIGNARGTSWVELSSNGKIDIFAEDSISIHTKNDLNIRADRDINMEAGRNVNIKATAEYQAPDSLYNEKNIFDGLGQENGRVQIESVENMNFLIGRNGKIHVRNDEQIQGNFDIKVMGNMRIAVQDKDNDPSHTNINDGPPGTTLENQTEEIKGLHIYSYENTRILTEKNVDIITKQNVKIKTNGNLDLNTDGNNAYTAGGTTDIKSGGNHTETAPKIHMNGPTARTAEIAEEAEIADKILPLKTHVNPVTDASTGWKDRYQVPAQPSIMRRIPMHEPWLLHENQAPQVLTPKETDRET